MLGTVSFVAFRLALPLEGAGISSIIFVGQPRWLHLCCRATLIVWFVAAKPAPANISIRRDGSWRRLRSGSRIGWISGCLIGSAIVVYQLIWISLTSPGWSTERFIEFVQWVVGAALSSVVLAVALALRAWICAPPQKALRVEPEQTRRRDRNAALLAAGISALVVGLLTLPTFAAAVVLGTTLGDLVTGWPGDTDGTKVSAAFSGAIRSARLSISSVPLAVAVTFLPALLVGGLVLVAHAWTRFAIANMTRFLGETSRSLPQFLIDTTEKGLLRRAGGIYQFRHSRLQESLVFAEPFPLASAGRARRRSKRLALVLTLVVVGGTALVAVPRLTLADSGLAIPAVNVVEARWGKEEKTILTASIWSPSVYTIDRWSTESGRRIGASVLAAAWATDPATGVLATVQALHDKSAARATVWDAESHKLFDLGQVTDLEFSPAGGVLATYNQDDKTVELMNESTGPLAARTFPNVLAGTFTPDGQAVLLIDVNLNATLIDASSGETIPSLSRDLGHSSSQGVHERSLAAPVLAAPPQVTPFSDPLPPPASISARYPLEGNMRGDLKIGSTGLAALDLTDLNSSPSSTESTPTNLHLWDLSNGAPFAVGGLTTRPR